MTAFLVRAQGDLLLFMDADTLVIPEAVRAASEAVGGCDTTRYATEEVTLSFALRRRLRALADSGPLR